MKYTGQQTGHVPNKQLPAYSNINIKRRTYLDHFRFPNQAVVDELARRGIPLSSTAERGALELVWSAPGQGGPLTFRLSGQRF